MKIDKNSKFVFIATSSQYLEDRFMYDVNHGIEILKSLGVAAVDIIISVFRSVEQPKTIRNIQA